MPKYVGENRPVVVVGAAAAALASTAAAAAAAAVRSNVKQSKLLPAVGSNSNCAAALSGRNPHRQTDCAPLLSESSCNETAFVAAV